MERYVAKDFILQTIDKLKLKNNSVIVYDIDNTLLDDNGFIIPEIVDTYFYAKHKGIQPILITARPGNSQSIVQTVKQLKNYNIVPKIIYFRPEHVQDVAEYKTKSRKNLWDKGYEVIMSVGDMDWDMGNYGGIGVKV